MTVQSVLKIAIVGAVFIGTWHAKVLGDLEGAELTCVVDTEHEAAVFPGVSSRIQVHGDKGSAVIENDELVYIHTTSGERAEIFIGAPKGSNNQVAQYADADARSAQTAASDPGQPSDAHRVQYQNFLDALAGNAKIVIGLDEARVSLSLILAIYESTRTGLPVAIAAPSATGGQS